MKTEDVKKEVMIEGGIIAAGLILLGGLLWGLSDVSDNYTQQNTTLKSDLDTLSGKTNLLYVKYSKVKGSLPAYQEAVEKLRQDHLRISREQVRDTFDKFNSTYYLNNFHVVMSGIDDLTTPPYKTDNYGMVSSAVTINFNAITDEDVFHMIDAMQQDLPGSARITRLQLTRAGVITPDILHNITTNGQASLVNGQIDFSWYGVKPLESGKANAEAPKK